MAKLIGIEIFAPGTWNGETYTNADMIEMVNNSNRVRGEFRALMSLNHSEVAPKAIEEAAFGVAVRYYLRKMKDGLLHVFADFENIPDKIVNLISYYPNRSIELYPKYRAKSGQIFHKVIACVSFLGAKMPPAVKGMLPDFVLSYHHDPALLAQQGKRVIFTYQSTRSMCMTKQFQDAAQLGAMLQQKRAELGVTEADIAEIAGVAAQTILDLEAGKVLPSEDLVEKLAEAYQIDSEVFNPAPPEKESDKEESSKEEVFQERKSAASTESTESTLKDEKTKQEMADLRAKLNCLEQERNDERNAREASEMAHFFEKMETSLHAAKILTGQRVREFASQLSTTVKMKFSEGDHKELSPRDEFFRFLESLAKAQTVIVPLDQITDPGQQQKLEMQDKVSEARSLIRKYQDDHKCEYMEARLAIKAERPELFVDAPKE